MGNFNCDRKAIYIHKIFLMQHFVDAVERALQDRNWYAALFLAINLPDNAGRIDSSNQKSGKRYEEWFNTYVGKAYGFGESVEWLTGADCYALRCAMVHEGNDDISQQRARQVLDKFKFVKPDYGVIHLLRTNTDIILQVDIFCRDICSGVSRWLSSIPEDDSRNLSLEAMMRVQEGDEFFF